MTRTSLARVLAGAAAFAVPVFGQNPEIILAAKFVNHVQTGVATSAIQDYSFEGFVDFSTPVSVTATVTPPGLSALALTSDTTPGMSYRLEQTFATSGALDAAFPDGNYAFTVSGIVGTYTAPNTAGAFPGGTLFTNWNTLQSAPTSSIPVTWNAFAGGSANDFVLLGVERAGGYRTSSPGPGEPGALNGTSTNYTIPTLPGAGTYTVTLSRYVLEEGTGPTDALVVGSRVFRLSAPLIVAGPPDTTAPLLLGASPLDGSTGVPGTTPLVLTFNEPMNQTLSNLSLSGVALSSWDTAWNDEGTVAVVTLPLTLPDGTYTLTLNPGSLNEFSFRDLAGNHLAINTVATTFTVGAGSVSSTRLVNISTFGFVSTGGDIMIAGFVVQGTSPRTFLIRGVGPGLAGFGLPGAPVLADPKLALFQGATRIAENDTWSSSANVAEIVAAADEVGAFPLANPSLDAALLVTLEPGTYTAQLFGVGDTPTGKGLIEVYELP